MKVSFSFDNGTSRIVLMPENARDKTYLSLCSDGRNDIRLKPTTDESLVIELTEHQTIKSFVGHEYWRECQICSLAFINIEDYQEHNRKCHA